MEGSRAADCAPQEQAEKAKEDLALARSDGSSPEPASGMHSRNVDDRAMESQAADRDAKQTWNDSLMSITPGGALRKTRRKYSASGRDHRSRAGQKKLKSQVKTVLKRQYLT